MAARQPWLTGNRKGKKKFARKFGWRRVNERLRAEAGKKPKMVPLQVNPNRSSFVKALREGRFSTAINGKPIDIPLNLGHPTHPVLLQGIYRLNNGKIITLRFKMRENEPKLEVFELEQYHDGLKEIDTRSWALAYGGEDLAHINVESRFSGQGVGTLLMQKLDEHVRCVSGTRRQSSSGATITTHRFFFDDNTTAGHFMSAVGYTRDGDYLQKTGITIPEHDMSKFCRIEAFSPSGRRKHYTIPLGMQ